VSTIFTSKQQEALCGCYHPRSPNVIQRIFSERFKAFEAAYEERYAASLWTIPRCLRVFLKHNRELHANLSRLMFGLLSDYFSQAVGRKITTGMVTGLQTFGEFAAWNPHWLVAYYVCCSPKHPGHTIVLEGGFDRWDRFFFIPLGASDELKQLWRVRVVEFILCMENKGRGPPRTRQPILPPASS
jgi:hypothetical protein